MCNSYSQISGFCSFLDLCTNADQDYKEYDFVDLTHCNYLDNQSSILSGQWNRILIPLEEISADKRVLNSLSFLNGNTAISEFWVDEVRFVGLSDPSQLILTPAILPNVNFTPTVGLGDTSQSPPNYPTITTSGTTDNGIGDRLSQTVNGVPTNYILDLNAGLTQVLDNGTTTTPTVLGASPSKVETQFSISSVML